MEEVLLRFALLGENIFDLLDDKSLVNCKKVSKTWNSFVMGQKFPSIRIIKRHDEKFNKNHTDCQQKWRKLFQKTKFEDVRQFAKRLQREYHSKTLFQIACTDGQSKIVEAFMQKSANVNIDLIIPFSLLLYACSTFLCVFFPIAARIL